MRERLLVRHFLRRFLEHDLISSNADRREVLSAVGGILVAVSLFLSVLTALNYQFNNFMPPGIASIRSLDDRVLFVSASMLVMALMAVVQWDALTLDARDTSVLGILPIPKAVIVRSKLMSVTLLAVGTCVAWNAAPIVLRGVTLPIALRIGFIGVLTLTLAQGVVLLAAGAFGFLAVLALRETLAALLGQDRFRSISAAVQAALIVLLTSALLLLAASGTTVRRRWVARDALATRLFPPSWFVGLHETLAGSVIDSLPRRRPQQFLVVPERDATALYRSLWPLYHELALLATAALTAAVIVTIAAYSWNSRRLPTSPVRRPRRSIATNIWWRWMVEHVVAPSPLHQAGFWFTLQTLPRRVSHRSLVASSFAIGLALIVITVRGYGVAAPADLASVPLAMFAGQSLLLASVLTGVRHAAQVPAELPASSTFSLASRGHVRPYISGVKRAAFVGIVSPILAALFLWHAALLGVRLAVFHSVFGVLLSMLLLEALFFRYRRVPFVSGYVPMTELKSQGVAYVVAMMCLSFLLAWIERLALETTSMYLLLLGVFAGLIASATAYDRSQPSSPGVLNLNEESPLPTQRLDLAR